MQAKAEGIANFSVFCNHVTIVPAIKAILESPDMRLDGFVGPGHVSTVIGCRPYEFIARDYGKPVVVPGFEPLDILQSIHRILRQLATGRSEVENQYARVVPWKGISRRSRRWRRSSSCGPTSSGGVWASSRNPPSRSATPTRHGTRKSGSPCPGLG
jgi:hydrogenase expression/formation protein HypD